MRTMQNCWDLCKGDQFGCFTSVETEGEREKIEPKNKKGQRDDGLYKETKKDIEGKGGIEMKPRIPVPQKPNKREIPKTVYNRKKAIPFSEFLDWLGDEVRPKPMSEEEYHKQCP